MQINRVNLVSQSNQLGQTKYNQLKNQNNNISSLKSSSDLTFKAGFKATRKAIADFFNSFFDTSTIRLLDEYNKSLEETHNSLKELNTSLKKLDESMCSSHNSLSASVRKQTEDTLQMYKDGLMR